MIFITRGRPLLTSRTAKIFTTDSGQAVELPAEFRFEGREVFVRRDPKTSDVILSRKPDSWDGLLQLHQSAEVPDDFIGPSGRSQPQQDRDPFEGWGRMSGWMLDSSVGSHIIRGDKREIIERLVARPISAAANQTPR